MRTKIFRRLGAKVVAVEPQSSCVAILRRAYTRDRRVMLVQAACGSAHGRAVMCLCDTDTLSSLSDEWIAAVSQSGRFSQAWSKRETCTLITIDELIHAYGSPAFIKIDVEGYELQVLQGLNQVVPCLSFEFTPERWEAAVECVNRLCVLGFREFNISWGESFELFVRSWVQRDEFVALLRSHRGDSAIFGDVYARS